MSGLGIITECNGKGIWSREPGKKIEIIKIELQTDWNELRAYFDMHEWNVDKHGLIYTDEGWLKTFRNELIKLGFNKKAVSDIDYSEQGMQQENYVSLDIGREFLNEVKNNPLLRLRIDYVSRN